MRPAETSSERASSSWPPSSLTAPNAESARPARRALSGHDRLVGRRGRDGRRGSGPAARGPRGGCPYAGPEPPPGASRFRAHVSTSEASPSSKNNGLPSTPSQAALEHRVADITAKERPSEGLFVGLLDRDELQCLERSYGAGRELRLQLTHTLVGLGRRVRSTSNGPVAASPASSAVSRRKWGRTNAGPRGRARSGPL